MSTDPHVTVRQSGTVPVVSHVTAWAWRCEDCGWVGTGWTSENGATNEASDHAWEHHHIAICGAIDSERQWGHPGHRWKHVPGTDAIDKCERCEETIGK